MTDKKEIKHGYNRYKILCIVLTVFLIIIVSISVSIYVTSEKAQMRTISVMTLNVQFYKPSDKHKNNIYSNLYNDIGQIILKYMPDVLCLQEDVSPRPFSLNIGMFYNEIISCEAQKIDWIDSVNYMTNTIFVRNDKNLSVKTYRQCILPDGGFAPRCAVSVNVDGITISNTHLQGGRYVDEQYKSMVNLKSEEMTNIIETLKPDIIVGDFNGGTNKYADILLRDYPVYKALNQVEKQDFIYYLTDVHELLKKKGYSPAYTEDQISKTSVYGGLIDWMYFKKCVTVSHVSAIMEILDNELSDHAGVMVTFEVK